MSSAKKLLLIIVKESDTWQGAPLYSAIVQRLRHLDVAGATVHAGMMGFGRHHRIHHKGLFGIADDRPVTIVSVDDEPTLRRALAEMTEMMAGALVLLMDAELISGGGSTGTSSS
jgi:PII-like signaling protein